MITNLKLSLKFGMVIMMLLAFCGMPTLSANAATLLVVDDDGFGTASNCNATTIAFSKIQDAVNSALAGDTILICPGTFDEQVAITKSDITIQGSGTALTVLQPHTVSVNSAGVLDPFPIAAILLITGATNVNVKGLTVDGSLADNGISNPPCLETGYYVGVYYRNSSGSIQSSHITNIGSATRCTSGVTVSSGFASNASLAVNNNMLDNYSNIGLNCGGPNTTCSVGGNTFQGLGPIDFSQAGIILRLGAGGEFFGNTIVDHFNSQAHGVPQFSVGIALFNAESNLNPHLLQTNFFSGNQINIQRQSTAAAFE
jgi:hypothetical protein